MTDWKASNAQLLYRFINVSIVEINSEELERDFLKKF